MSTNLVLLPVPRHLNIIDGTLELTEGRLILLTGAAPSSLLYLAKRFQQILKHQHSLTWEIVASASIPKPQIGLILEIKSQTNPHPQAYDLTITPTIIRVIGNEPAGLFYGVCTLIQILDQCGPHLPCLHISDWPDFPGRGVMLDISRDKVPTMETIYSLVDMLAGWKINQFQLYTEHTFAYRNHPEVWEKASPFSGQDILDLDEFCQKRFIELIPNQNSFGHMNRWLIHPRYASLAEVTQGFDVPWGHMDGPFTIYPLDPASLDLITSLYDELLPHFSSRKINVGCDETFDLGQGRSKDEVARLGAGRVYLDFLLKIYKNIKERGFTMQFWGDIIIQHPELIPELPKDLVALEWGYEADHPFDEHGVKFAETGIPFYVCPGTSSWNSLAGRTDNALGNLLNAAENGLKHGAIGYLNTDWGDNGHWQTFPVSFLGFAAGAAYSWALDENRTINIPAVLNRYAFHDQAGIIGQAVYDLGNVHKIPGIEPHNASILFTILQTPLDELHLLKLGIDYPRVINTLNTIAEKIIQSKMDRPDASLVLQEFDVTVRMLIHACRRGQLASQESRILADELNNELQTLIQDYKQTWLARNRFGGLSDSLARLEKARMDYLT